MKLRSLISALLFLCAANLSAQVQPPAYFEDTTGKTYASYTESFANPIQSGSSIVCATQYGSVNAAISLTDDKGDVFLRLTGFWDANHRQGVVIHSVQPATAGAQAITIKTNGSVNYVATSCEELKIGPLDSAKSADATALALNPPATDVVYAAIVEDTAGSGDTFTVNSGFTFGKNDGAHAFADAIGAGNPTFTVSPANNTILAAVAFQPVITIPQPLSFAVPGLGTTTFPLTGPQVSQLYCAATDGVCSIQIQVCDGNVPPNCLASGAGTLYLVKTVTLPVPQISSTVLATVKPFPPSP